MYGFGHGSHFVAHLDLHNCENCSNTVTRQLLSQYSSQMVLGITEHTYAAVSVICPICHHGCSKQFTPFNSRMGKLFGGAAAKKSQAEATELLTLLGKQINLSATRSYYETLSRLLKYPPSRPPPPPLKR